MKEYFSNINGGLGLDHWSPSSTDMPLAKWITNYGYHTGEERDKFLMNYKPRIGNLTNNTSQRLLCEYRYFKDKKSKVHSTSRGWEKALKKRGNKKQRQFDKKLAKGGY